MQWVCITLIILGHLDFPLWLGSVSKKHIHMTFCYLKNKFCLSHMRFVYHHTLMIQLEMWDSKTFAKINHILIWKTKQKHNPPHTLLEGFKCTNYQQKSWSEACSSNLYLTNKILGKAYCKTNVRGMKSPWSYLYSS